MSIMNSSPGTVRTLRTSLLVTLALASAGCAMSNKGKGMAIGTATGGAAGAVIGNQTGSTTRGAIIGAVVGGAAGAIIGSRMDQQAQELMTEIPGATIVRVGEGIQVTFASGLLYDLDSYQIKTAAGANLRTLARSLKKYPNTNLLIVGHTDNSGTAEYNQDLSTLRAEAASVFLVTEGIEGRRLRTSGMGESEPVASNRGTDGRALNRRIEVAIFASEAARGSS